MNAGDAAKSVSDGIGALESVSEIASDMGITSAAAGVGATPETSAVSSTGSSLMFLAALLGVGGLGAAFYSTSAKSDDSGNNAKNGRSKSHAGGSQHKHFDPNYDSESDAEAYDDDDSNSESDSSDVEDENIWQQGNAANSASSKKKVQNNSRINQQAKTRASVPKKANALQHEKQTKNVIKDKVDPPKEVNEVNETNEPKEANNEPKEANDEPPKEIKEPKQTDPPAEFEKDSVAPAQTVQKWTDGTISFSKRNHTARRSKQSASSARSVSAKNRAAKN